MDTITMNDWPTILKSVAAVMDENAEMLCAMDANMGDGDLGLTMKKGYESLPVLFGDIDEADMGKRLMKAGFKMASVVPSTMGTLMASGWMEGGKKLAGVTKVGSTELAAFFQGFADGIVKRGKCKEGERTLLDAIQPAATMAQESANQGKSLQETAKAALVGAKAGVEATKQMVPKHGKAAVFSEKAKGIPDQGATAGMLLIEGILQGIEKENV